MPANKDILQITHTRDDACTVLSNKLMSWVPSPPQEYIVLCIGTDRSTGDSLGPLTGTFLSEINPQQLHVYGTLNKPVHAKNLSTSIQQIKDRHNNPSSLRLMPAWENSSQLVRLLLEKALSNQEQH